jgi:Flp pilus assembly protein TadD
MTQRARQDDAAQRKAQAFLQHFTTALKHHEAGALDQAEREYRRALTFNPDDATTHTNLGVALYAQGRIEEAVKFHRRAVSLEASSIGFNNLGVALNALHRYPEAVEAYAKAVALDPENVKALSNYGDALTNSGRYAESVEQLYKALALAPDYAEAHSNLGMAYWGLGKLDQAVASFRVCLALQPNLAMARKNLGIVLLLRGQYAQGWQEYDWRWTADRIPLRPFPYPLWLGKPVDGEVLIWGEQGPGDEILQASMIEDLVRFGVRVVWECDPRLAPLFQRSYPQVRIVPRDLAATDMGPEVKAQLPAASLGHLLRPDVSRFPVQRRSFLKADAERAARYRAGFGLRSGERLVGISWLSKNVVFGEKKSTALADWAEILRTPGCRFVDLQYGDTAAERAALTRDLGLTLEHVEGLDLRDDLDGLAALISACDLVVTVSNTTAHVAGALGVPVWIFVAAGGGKLWYWGTEDVEVPVWYPSARIIRQKRGEPWNVSLQLAAQRLAGSA